MRAASVTHPGPTLGYRIDDGDTSLAYIPDHELAPGRLMSARERESLSGFELARDASLLVHDCQYTDDEYPHHIGWGHSRLSDVLTFAELTCAKRLLLFHHDPRHDDEQLDRLHREAVRRWEAVGRRPHELLMAAELQEIELDHPGAGLASTARR